VEARAVPYREHALLGGGGEVGLEPRLLRRAHGSRHIGVRAVQHDDVPRPEIVALVAGLGRVARGCTEIGEIRDRGGAGVVFVVAGRRVRAGLVAAPRGVIAVLVVRCRPVGEGVVADREHGAGNRVEDGRRGRVAGGGTAGDVPRPDERHTRHCDGYRDGDLAGAWRAVLVCDRHAYRVGTGRGVRVRGGNRGRLTGCAPSCV